MTGTNTKLTIGVARYFVPVCIRHSHGYYGGPAGYEEVTEENHNHGPIIVDRTRTTNDNGPT